MKKRNKEIGNLGENIARNYLENIGYIIIKTNYFSRYGEIDIIAKKDKNLVFIEVKTRTTDFYSPREAVDFSKQKKIQKTAMLYLNEFHEEYFLRFDIIEIVLKINLKLEKCIHLENVF